MFADISKTPFLCWRMSNNINSKTYTVYVCQIMHEQATLSLSQAAHLLAKLQTNLTLFGFFTTG